MKKKNYNLGARLRLCCPLPESVKTLECFNGEQRWDLAHTQDDVNPHIVRMREDIFHLKWASYGRELGWLRDEGFYVQREIERETDKLGRNGV